MKDEYGSNIKMVNDYYKATMVARSGRFNADLILATVLLSAIYGKAWIRRVEALPFGFSIDHPLIVTYGFKIENTAFNFNIGGETKFRENGIPYGISGSIWRQCGRVYCSNYPNPEKVFNKIDSELIQGIDAAACGYYLQDNSTVHMHTIIDAIENFNPPFKSDTSDTDFLKAVRFTQPIFYNALRKEIGKSISSKSIK